MRTDPLHGPRRRRALAAAAVLAVAVVAVVVGAAAATASAGQADPGDAESPQIIGGEDVADGELPFVAGLMIPGGSTDPFDSQYCTGVLIAPDVIATTAFCNPVVGEEALLGQVELSTPITGEVRTIGAVSIRPAENIALVELTAPSTQAPVAFAVPGDESLYEPGTLGTVAGWGTTGFVEDVPQFDATLQSVEVPVVADGDCDAAYAETFDLSANVCAGGEEVGPCILDEGSPLVVDDGGDPLLVGIASFGPSDCAVPDVPDVYVEVAAFTDYLDAHIDAPAFTDVGFSHPFLTEIWALSHDPENAVLGGFPDGSYRPAQAVTRQAMSAFMYRLAGEPEFDAAGPTFPDVAPEHPFFLEIEWMAAEGITTGFLDGTFRPAAVVTRQAMSAFMYRLAGEPAFTPPGAPSFPDVPLAHPFFLEIEWMAAEEITTGLSDGTFKPAAVVTRQAMAAFMYRLQPLL